MNSRRVVNCLLSTLLVSGVVTSVNAEPNNGKGGSKSFIDVASKGVANSCKGVNSGWKKELCDELFDANGEVSEELEDVLEEIDREFGHMSRHHKHAGDEVKEEYEDIIHELEDVIDEIPHESVRTELTSILNAVREAIENGDYKEADKLLAGVQKEETKANESKNNNKKYDSKYGIYVNFVTGLEDGELKVNLEVALKAYEDAVKNEDKEAAKEASKIIEESMKDSKEETKKDNNKEKYQGTIDVELMQKLIANISDEEIKAELEVSLKAYTDAVASGDEAKIKEKEEAFKKDLKDAETKIKEKNGFNNANKSKTSLTGLFNRMFGWIIKR